jgi:hypothetical protein
MTTQASILFRCPYCRLGEGDLTIDAGQVAIFALENPDAFEVRLQDLPESKLVVHNAESGAPTPCPHLVNYSIGVLLSEARDGDREMQGELSLLWKHQWFAENDFDEVVSEFLWHHLALEALRFGSYPRSLHHISHPNCTLGTEHGQGQSGWVLGVNAVIIVASEPVAFLEELREIEQIPA